MNQQIDEKLSALMDDALPKHELAAVLDRLGSDPAERALWDRYHLIGDAIRGEAMRLEAQGISKRVSAMLEEEPTVLSPGAAGRPQPHWVKPAVGSALAASVAVLAILGAPRFISEGETPSAPAVAGNAIVPQTPVMASSSSQVVVQAAPRSKFVPAAARVRVPPQTLEVAAQAVAPLPMERLYEVRSGTRWDVAEPAVESKLNAYLVTHQEYAPATNISGILPYATFVGYDSHKQ